MAAEKPTYDSLSIHIVNNEFQKVYEKLVNLIGKLDLKNMKDGLGFNLFGPFTLANFDSSEKIKKDAKDLAYILKLHYDLDINEKNSYVEMSVLHKAIYASNFGCARFFIENGADPAIKNNRDDNIFHLLTLKNKKDIPHADDFVAFLKTQNFPVENLINQRNRSYKTPLDVALDNAYSTDDTVLQSTYDLCSFLVRHGAKDTYGQARTFFKKYEEKHPTAKTQSENVSEPSNIPSMKYVMPHMSWDTNAQTTPPQNQQNPVSEQAQVSSATVVPYKS